VTLASVTQIIWVSARRPEPGNPRSWTLGNIPLLLIPVLVLLGGGASLLAGGGGGIYWLLFGTALVFIAASINAWVLLVEILR
jgi:modulator of FtsH protease